MPNGVAYHKGDLYVAEVNKIWVFKNIEENLSKYFKCTNDFFNLSL